MFVHPKQVTCVTPRLLIVSVCLCLRGHLSSGDVSLYPSVGLTYRRKAAGTSKTQPEEEEGVRTNAKSPT